MLGLKKKKKKSAKPASLIIAAVKQLNDQDRKLESGPKARLPRVMSLSSVSTLPDQGHTRYTTLHFELKRNTDKGEII